MGLIRTLVDYGQQAYDGLKPPAKTADQPAQSAVEDINYPQIKLSGEVQTDQKPKLSVKEFRQSLGQDTAFIQMTIRQKLAEYGANPRANVQLYRDDTGAIRLNGNLPAETAANIEQDINRNPDFKHRYLRISQNQPTLEYIQNNLNIRQTYGSNNSLFDSLISADPANNSLQDLTTRFSNLGKGQRQGNYSEADEKPAKGFSISV
ncbi:hypothetical protein BTA51_15860 [Hahella sp. CCB-MM4]|uniref:hypothetical protein n=1 Tax=Hahella sp. (strain CCB-MM4) TaxID=1926491 RepID=UPI000B9AA368|nr:hypothetical protein [Hahella sp. CCB-MM4]OZG72583.1 hypothetical protein BTA51_15860 [Hahella sp. CCB-MM4]